MESGKDKANDLTASGWVSHLAHSTSNLIEAQLALTMLKSKTIILGMVFGFLVLLGLAVLGVYGLYLFDKCLAVVLSGTSLPNWSTYLLRGLLYVSLSAAGFYSIWCAIVGRNAAARSVKAKSQVKSDLENLKTNLDPANIIRENPWGATFSVLLAGILVVPLLKNLQPLKAGLASRQASNDNDSRQSLLYPVITAVLSSLPALVAAFNKTGDLQKDPRRAMEKADADKTS